VWRRFPSLAPDSADTGSGSAGLSAEPPLTVGVCGGLSGAGDRIVVGRMVPFCGRWFKFSVLLPVKGIDVLRSGRYRVQLNAFKHGSVKKFSRNAGDLYEVRIAASRLTSLHPTTYLLIGAVAVRGGAADLRRAAAPAGAAQNG
jgi:hypothetical protein